MLLFFQMGRLGRFLHSLYTFFQEFCENSNIHGVRYFTERRLHWSERCWWLISCGISLWLCSSMTRNIWMQWQNNPVIMKTTENMMPLSAVPFPQVTICPIIKNMKTKFNLASALSSSSNLSVIDKMRLNALAHVCPNLNSIQSREKYTNESIFDIIEDIAPEISDSFSICYPAFKDIPCEKAFAPVLMEEGLCFAYNALNSHETFTNEMSSRLMIVKNNTNVSNWSLENGYGDQWSSSEYPIRRNYSGMGIALTIYFMVKLRDFEYNCRGADNGFDVILSMPGDTPKMSRNSFRHPILEGTVITVTPTLTTTSDGLHSHEPSQRQCFYQTERRLRFYKIYTKPNCEAECLANFTKIECGCVRFSMPRDNKTRICAAGSITCYKLAESKFSNDARVKTFRDECNCLPSCSSIEYNVNIDRVAYDYEIWDISRGNKPRPMNQIKNVISKLSVYYRDPYVKAVKRVEMYTMIDFLSYCGGLLGLFLGMSVLSIIELIYYSTLRLFWTIHQSSSSIDVANQNERRSTNSIFPRIGQVVWSFVENVCINSNILGVRYLWTRSLHWSERVWWLISLSLSLWLCGSMIRDIWVSWRENPVTMSTIETGVAKISSIPFPTVTICPDIKSVKQKFNIRSAIESASASNLSDTEKSRLNALGHICQWTNYNMKTYMKTLLYENETIFDTFKDIALELDDVMLSCRWKKKKHDCSEYWTPVFTELGLCFAFNAINSREIYTDNMASGMMIVNSNPSASQWSLENGYGKEADYPMRAIDSGRQAGLDIELMLDKRNLEYDCLDVDQGFKVITSVPGDDLKVARNSFPVSLLENILISIKPKMITTSEELHSYAPNQRNCFFNSERQLRYFRTYSSANCIAECIANGTNERCGCTGFSMPRDNNSSKICGMENSRCYRITARKFSMNSTFEGLIHSKCNCKPLCMSIEYNLDIDRVKLNMATARSINKAYPHDDNILRTRLSIFFGDERVETLKRVETYTLTDFLAICGGLLGLFLGISALSVIELIYYSTLRLYWSIRRSRHESGAAVSQ